VGIGGLGDGSPPRGSRGGAPVLGAKSPRSQIQKQFAAVKCFSTHVSCRVRPPYLAKNSSDLRESHDPTRPGQGGHGTCPPVAMLPITVIFPYYYILLVYPCDMGNVPVTLSASKSHRQCPGISHCLWESGRPEFKYDALRSNPLPSCAVAVQLVSGCRGNNRSWYPVLSNLTSQLCT